MRRIVSRIFTAVLVCFSCSTVFANTIEQPVTLVQGVETREENKENTFNEAWSAEEIIEYINNGTQEFSTYNEIDINEILKESKVVMTRASGDVEATYQSTKMKTGTPGVTWGYTLEYVATPLSSGYGYKFKSVDKCTVTYYKNNMQLTWCDYCDVSFTKTPTYSIASTGKSITVKVYLDFTVYYTVGILPSKNSYSEVHSDTVSMSNGSLV